MSLTAHSPALLALLTVTVVWAGGFVAAGTAVGPDGGFGPLWLTATRLSLAGLLVSALAWHRAVALPGRQHLPSILASGVLAWLGGSGLQTIGQQTVPASTTALVQGAGPLVVLALASAADRRPPTLRELGLVVLGLSGLAIAVGPSAAGPGLGWVIAACLCWSTASAWEAQRPDSGGHPLAVGALQMLAGGAAVTVLAVLADEPLPQPSTAGWMGFTWLALACAAVGLPLWLYVLRNLPLHLAMTQATLTPIVATCLSALLLGEPLGPGTVLGGAVVLAAAGLTVRPTSTMALPPSPAPQLSLP